MPFKCLTCNKLGSTDKIACDQKDKTACDVRRVEVIHYAHAKGTGRVVAKGQRQVASPVGTQDKVLMEELKLCCESTIDRPQYTPALHAVTCLKCIEAASKLDQPSP